MENIPANEARHIDEMIEVLQHKMAKDYPAGSTKRDAHPKSLGLVKANFTVEATLPANMQVGLFQPSATYASWIRFSNASGKIQSDTKKDFRGIAIKLLGVAGPRVCADEQHSQDFVFLSHPTMPLGTVKLFRDAVYYSTRWHAIVLALKFALSGRLGILFALRKGQKHDTSVLAINYWSTTPYAFGDSAVKYKLVPRSTIISNLPATLKDDYLTQNMQEHLRNGSACFDLFVQQFTSQEQTPIEDAGIEWSETDSPLIKVASIEIPMQEFDTAQRHALAESYSFSPANSLLVHKPLGGLNRARSAIYSALSKFRHERDGQLQVEP